MTAITMSYVGKQRERPPRVRVDFDVFLHNQWDSPRWIVLPLSYGKPSDEPYGLIELASYMLQDNAGNKVTVSRLRSLKGCYALFLDAGVQITLRALPVYWYETLPHTATLITHVANNIRVGEDELSTWFEVSTLNSMAADVSATALQDDMEISYSKTTPDLGQLPITLDGSETIEVQVKLA